MGPDDLQISSVWTEPGYRNRGLATRVARLAVGMNLKPGRRFWYIARIDNPASVAVSLKAGFSLAGTAHRGRRLGVRLLGSFELDNDADEGNALRRIA
jgi:predicted GNAT family acetyltransferase